MVSKNQQTSYVYKQEEPGEAVLKDILIQRYGYSSRLLRRIVHEGEMSINQVDCWLGSKTHPGDRIEIVLPLEKVDVLPVEGPLDIVYEDDEILAVNKDPHCVTHPTKSHQMDTLGNRVAWYFQETGQDAKIRFVNRLDMDTSGLVIIAKNKYVHHYLQSQKVIDQVEKTYIAFINGRLPCEEGLIDEPIGLPFEGSIKRAVLKEGKPSRTRYRVLETYKEAQMIELQLETGRTHQIRVHLSYMGCPVIGDGLYNIETNESYGMERVALHSKRIVLTLPKRGKCVLEAAMKPDLIELKRCLSNV